MTANIRDILDCIDVDASGTVSILGDMFGFTRARVPPDPDTGVVAEVSLLRLVNDLQARHLHLNVIRVGWDTLSDADEAEGFEKLDYAIYRIRDIYQSVSLGIGRVNHFFITDADANGRGDIGSQDEANALWDEWTVPGNALDVFVVRNISHPNFVGLSPVDGTCTKDAKDDGLLGGEIGRGFEEVARTFAHEIGHYLGLSHNHDDGECPTSTSGRNNLMAQTACAISVRTSVNLSSSQGSDMRDHCSVRSGC